MLSTQRVGATPGRVAVLICVVHLLCVGALPPSSPASDPTPEEALRDLNAWRARAGMPPLLGFKPEWNEACRLHNRYQELNHIEVSHEEVEGNPEWTMAGMAAGQTSVLSSATDLPYQAWHDAVYHRTSILQPRARWSGYDASEGRTCLKTIGGVFDTSPAAQTSTPVAYPWPPSGATEVPRSFQSYESPNPFDQVPGVEELGYLLSANFNGPWSANYYAHMVTTSASVSSRGRAIPVTVSAELGADRAEVILLPHGAYPACAPVNAEASGLIDMSEDPAGLPNQPFSVTWSFRTVCPRKRSARRKIGIAVRRIGKKKIRVRVRLANPDLAEKGRVVLVVRSRRARRVVKLGRRLERVLRLAPGTWRVRAVLVPSRKYRGKVMRTRSRPWRVVIGKG